MSLDNANPTIFQNASGGGRKRFKNILVSKVHEKEGDEMAVMDIKQRLNYQPASKYSLFLQQDEAPRKEVGQSIDYIDSQEIYGEAFLCALNPL